MEKSSTPACLGFFRHAKLLRPAGVGVVKVSGEVEFLVVVSLQPLLQCIEVRGQCELSHADGGRGEVGGKNCDQGIKDWEVNLNNQGHGEAERREARFRQVFMEGKEDIECIRDCGGGTQEEGNVEEEGSVEEGVGTQEEGFAVQQPNTYEADRNKRVTKVQERLQLLFTAKSSMWVGSICGFSLFLGCGCSLSSSRLNCKHGMWSMIARTVTPARSPPNPKTTYLVRIRYLGFGHACQIFHIQMGSLP
jgi:hypothetical protein